MLRIADHPPPVLEDPADAARTRGGIGRLLARSRIRFARLFLRGRPLLLARRERRLFAALDAQGIVMRFGSTICLPRVRFFPIEGKFVATDLLSRREEDQVFSLMFEQAYFVRNIDVRPGDAVLELCVGSGVNSLFAADRAARVTGVDVSPRALAFACYNAALNGAEVELLEGSLFEPVAGRRFDLVLANPPFEPVPPDADWFLHSAGGEDGLDVVRGILAAVDDHLTPAGRFEMITWSPGSAAGPALAPMLQAALPGYAIRVDLLLADPIAPLLDRFAGRPGYEAWRSRLAARGFDRISMVFVRAVRGAGPALELRYPAPEVAAARALADSW